jgi:hypothetical protein
LNSGFKSKAEEIEWRRSKILELKSQGLEQREIAQVLRVSPALISYDVQCMRKEAIETVKDYTVRQLPLQFKDGDMKSIFDQYKDGEWVYPKPGERFSPNVYHSPEYIRRRNEESDKMARYESNE